MKTWRRAGALLALTAFLTFAQPHAAQALTWSSFRSTATNWLYSLRQPTAVTRTTAATSQTATAKTVAPTTSATSTEQMLINLANAERKRAGLEPLQRDAKVSSAAQAKANEMAARNYFSHTSPTYGSVESMLRSFGVPFSLAGENIGQGPAPEQVHAMWLNSSAHLANIRSRKFTHVGIGVAKSGSGYVISQIFTAR